ncbi:MAG TPA: TlpA disulfide reductase family protein [Candidatus Dormibacteraeota bacterium]|nr:TlpA disulfide reductase family protein [Candidatus Dormibacteraeota bacterium]
MLLASLLALVLSACSVGASPSSATGIGQPAPGIKGTTLDGSTVDLATFRGKPVVVNFWASWCVPCRAEFPVIRDAAAAHAKDGLVVVGVLYKDEADPARSFVSSFGARWPTVVDADGSVAAEYRVVAPPQSYFIDARGVLRGMQIGEMRPEDFARQYAAIAP